MITSRSIMKRRIALTILGMYTILRCEPDRSLKTILDPFTGTHRSGTQNFHDFVRVSKLPNAKPFLLNLLFCGFKSGPWAAPSVLRSHVDAKVLLEPIYSKILEAVLGLASISYNEEIPTADPNEREAWFLKWIKDTATLCSLKEPELTLAKFSFLSDKGGKTRLITCANYFIQVALYPLHQSLMSYLCNFKMDFTYNHNAANEWLQRWTAEGRMLHCFDLSAATDRFPLDIQKVVLVRILGKSIADFWETLMRIPIRIRPRPPSEYSKGSAGGTFHFACGQPMGLYSS